MPPPLQQSAAAKPTQTQGKIQHPTPRLDRPRWSAARLKQIVFTGLQSFHTSARAHVAGLPHLTVLRRRPRAVPALSQFLRNTKPCARAREHKQKREETYAYLHVGTHATQGGTFTSRRRSCRLNLRRRDRRYRENSRWPSVHHAPLHPLSLRSQSVVRACCCAHQMTKTCSLAPVSVWLVLLQTQKRAESFCQFALAAAWLPRGVLTVRFAIPLCRQSPWRHYRFVDWPGLERALGLHAHWCKAALVALQSRSS